MGVLAVRVFLVGLERVLLRRMGEAAGGLESSVVFFGLASLMLLPLVLISGVHWLPLLRWALPSGLVYAVAYWLYVSALTSGEVSRLGPLSSLSGILVAVLAVWTHHETLGGAKALGVLLVVVGSIWLQAPARGEAQRTGGTWKMLLYAVLSAATRLLDKSGAGMAAGSGAAAYALVVFGTVTVTHLVLTVLLGRMTAVGALLRAHPVLSVAAALCNGGSFLLLLLALGAVPVSVAEPVTALSLLVSTALAGLFLREPVRGRWAPTLAVVAGTWLLIREVAVPAMFTLP